VRSNPRGLHFFLAAGGHVLDLVATARELAVANDYRKARAQFARGAKRLLELRRLVVDLDAQALATQLADEGESGRERRVAKPSDVGGEGGVPRFRRGGFFAVRSVFDSARRWQSTHIVDFTLPSARRSTLTYSGRHFAQPTELSSSVKLRRPTRSRNSSSISRTSASIAGWSEPRTSAPIW